MIPKTVVENGVTNGLICPKCGKVTRIDWLDCRLDEFPTWRVKEKGCQHVWFGGGKNAAFPPKF